MNPRPNLDPPRVFLVGFMGAGKSAAGRIVAAKLGWEFEDTDALVESAEGLSIEELFRRSGEGAFRELEWRALQQFESRRDVVVAAGGGLFLGTVQRAFLKQHGRTIWLDAPLACIRLRLGTGPGRPLWTGDDPVAQRAFFEKRRAAYALADARVDSGDGGPEVVAKRIFECLSGFRR